MDDRSLSTIALTQWPKHHQFICTLHMTVRNVLWFMIQSMCLLRKQVPLTPSEVLSPKQGCSESKYRKLCVRKTGWWFHFQTVCLTFTFTNTQNTPFIICKNHFKFSFAAFKRWGQHDMINPRIPVSILWCPSECALSPSTNTQTRHNPQVNSFWLEIDNSNPSRVIWGKELPYMTKASKDLWGKLNEPSSAFS